MDDTSAEIAAEIAALAEQQHELSALLAGLDEREWARPSRCEGWSIADVVLHLAQTNEMALASLNGTFVEFLTEVGRDVGGPSGVDDGAALMVARERGLSNDALRDRYERGATALRTAFASDDPHRRVPWVVGDITVRTLATTRLAETWIHSGDVAYGLGVEPEHAERLELIARLAWRTLPYACAREGRELHGPIAFELSGPTGASWTFTPDDEPRTTIRGDAHELCLVAGRRLAPADTGLTGEGPDADAVLEFIRTYA